MAVVAIWPESSRGWRHIVLNGIPEWKRLVRHITRRLN